MCCMNDLEALHRLAIQANDEARALQDGGFIRAQTAGDSLSQAYYKASVEEQTRHGGCIEVSTWWM